MVLNNLFSTNKIIGMGLDASTLRNEVIQNNIANSDTPGFKRSVVKFEESLENEIYKIDGYKEYNSENVKATIEKTGANMRLDENNVDINIEMIDSYKNSVKFDTMASSVMNNYKRINVVLQK